jgi:hypothetical protein
MSDLCSSNTETINISNYNDDFKTKTGKSSVLPNSGSGFSSSTMSSTGVVTTTAMASHITQLLASTDITAEVPLSATMDNPNKAKTFAEKAAALRSKVRDEYCFYYVRYRYILKTLLGAAATVPGLTDSTLVSGVGFGILKTNTQTMNSKLNQLIQILQGLEKSRNTSLQTQYYTASTGVNSVNNSLDATRNSLVTHSNILKNNELETDVKKSMVDYTLEKNTSSRNLLAVYGFMNIIAGGLLFYLYRASKQ